MHALSLCFLFGISARFLLSQCTALIMPQATGHQLGLQAIGESTFLEIDKRGFRTNMNNTRFVSAETADGQ
ncbi:hypothetical protein CRM22_001982, partial [Opisthorchis felineus]